MHISLLFHTIWHLRPVQVFYQVWYRLAKPALKNIEAPISSPPEQALKIVPIPREQCLNENHFKFLNLDHRFSDWNFTNYGMLWAYNQNYFDWINQEGFSEEEGGKWIDRFIRELPSNKIGLDPYTISLRSVNWVKFFCRFPGSATKSRLDSLYSQVKLLEKKLEFHILGNHLLEDAFALFIGASFFQDSNLLKKAKNLLKAQLKEQVLPDGAHFEQSPMYHCILLDRLLDCINIATEADFKCDLSSIAERMLGYLESVVYSDGSIPLLNDSANGIAPLPTQIFDYAKRLGLKWKAIPMKESGYRKLTDGPIEAMVDIGNVMATYQPGHTHADTFSYELRIAGKPFVVDTGISTYNKNERRQYERSTEAHNTVVVDGKNSSEVWGGFRVGRRASVVVKREEINDSVAIIEVDHDGYGKPCRRRFVLKDGTFTVDDWFDGEAVSFVHLAEGADAERIQVVGASQIDIKPCDYSTEYNKFHKGKVLEIRFKGHCQYSIQ